MSSITLRILFGLLIFGWFGCLLNAQTPQIQFDLIDKKKGLGDVTYNFFHYQDSKGFYWISDTYNWYRFDGHQVSIQDDPLNPGYTDFIISGPLFEDEKGMFWSARSSIVFRYDPWKGRYKYYQVRNPDGKEYDDGIVPIYLDTVNKEFWIRADKEILALSLEDPSKTRVLFDDSRSHFLFPGPPDASGKVKYLWGAPWIGGDGLEWIDLEKGTRINFFTESGNSGKIGTIVEGVVRILPQSDSLVWVCTTHHGLVRFNPYQIEQAEYFLPPGQSDFGLTGGVIVGGEKMLLTSFEQGLWLFDLNKNKYVQNWLVDESEHSLASNELWSIFLDFQKHLWVSGKGSGINYSRFPIGQELPSFTSLLRGEKVVALTEDSLGYIWVSTFDNGIIRLSPSGDIIENYPLSVFGDDPIWWLHKLNDGTLVAISRKELFELVEGVGWQKIPKEIPVENFMNTSLGESGELILQKYEGVFQVVKNGAAWSFDTLINNGPALSNDVSIALKARDGSLIIHGVNDTIYRLEESSASRKTFHPFYVYDMVEEPAGNAIYMPSSNGLSMLQPETMTMTYLNVDTLLASGNGCFKVQFDHSGKLWFVTENRLGNYAPSSNQIRFFGEKDGVPPEGFKNESVFFLASDGRIWLGTSGGLTVFDPETLNHDRVAPEVHIANLDLGGGQKYARWGDSLVTAKKSLTLFQERLPFSLELRAVAFYLPEETTVRYRIAGEPSWKFVDDQDLAKFAMLPVGTHKLEMQAINANGIVGPTRTMTIRIRVQFWQTLWFRILAGFLIVALILLIFWNYVRQQIHKKELIIQRQEAQEQERSRIAQEMHDDMGSGLSSIIFLTGGMIRETEDAKMKSKLNKVEQSSNALIEKMEEIIWALNPENDDLGNLSFELRRTASEFLNESGIEVRVEMPESFPELEVSGEKRRNIYLIVKECLHNIAKHAKASVVDLSIGYKDSAYLIDIRDDGQGFDPEKINNSRNGMRNLRKRAASLQAQFEVHSSPGAGTQCHLSVPMGNNHL